MVGAVFEGVGVSLGSLLAGNLFFKIGGSKTFRWFGTGALILFVVHVVIQFVMDKLGSRGKKVDEKIANDSMLTRPITNGTTNNGIEVDCIISKDDSILSQATVQEVLDSPKSEDIEGKPKSDF